LLHIAVRHGNFSDIETPEWENMRVLLASVSRSRVQRGFTPEREREFHFILQKAIVRSQFFKGVMMPDLTGFEVLEELKSDRATCQIPAIVMTSQY
jgi:CheY-like chemotaxis protein